LLLGLCSGGGGRGRDLRGGAGGGVCRQERRIELARVFERAGDILR
jgi:hypothetical protein